ncbi:hypothetical protein AVEN_102750-1 [Araneus ventricosus]|uniref:Uncharacterized protein n=1 Tax=Araneus ventricosus TaxID=182803 RepID=A0A4Y2VWT6_ARAVE|nr:hypothetical protein AVEN_102750-1 [Araneus ventricosus]
MDNAKGLESLLAGFPRSLKISAGGYLFLTTALYGSQKGSVALVHMFQNEYLLAFLSCAFFSEKAISKRCFYSPSVLWSLVLKAWISFFLFPRL